MSHQAVDMDLGLVSLLALVNNMGLHQDRLLGTENIVQVQVIPQDIITMGLHQVNLLALDNMVLLQDSYQAMDIMELAQVSLPAMANVDQD